jgi:hypothetical protein
MKKLNPLEYMLAMGMGLGSSLGGIYSLIVWFTDVLASSYVYQTDWGSVFGFSLTIFVVGASIGAGAGLVLGLLDGFFLLFISYKRQNPFELLDKKPAIQAVIAILTTLGGFLILYLMILGNIQGFYSSFGIFALLPPFIAGAAAVYASQRYFVLISPNDKQKEKRKNDDSL